jgi:hypothetical protein
MNRHSQKISVYGKGLERVNHLVLLNLAVKEPETLQYNPDTDGPISEGQLTVLDPSDPITYVNYAHFPAPLPLDKLVLLNELQQKMGMGLESKEGALRALGEEFTEEKLEEIRTELIEDAQSDGALNLVKIQIQKQIMDMTGMMPSPDGSAMPMEPSMLGDGDVMGDGVLGPQTPEAQADPVLNTNGIEMQGESAIRNKLVTDAYGTKLSARRPVEKDN